LSPGSILCRVRQQTAPRSRVEQQEWSNKRRC
jgi:hypothetical protein